MDRIRVLFFFGLLGIVILIARFASKTNAPAGSPVTASASPAIVTATLPPPVPAPAASSAPVASNQPIVAAQPQPSATVSADILKIAHRITPSVVLISTFDPAGGLLATGAGCFVSHDGRFITTSKLAQGTANAVAKVADGRIINVSGILADSAEIDLAVLKADTKRGVPFISPAKAIEIQPGTRVAVVGSPLSRPQPLVLETTIAARRSDQSGEWLELSAPVPNECIGAPVVTDKGELIGTITSQKGQGPGTNVVRIASTLDALVAKIDSRATAGWLVAANGEPASPSESPTPTPPARFAKIPMVQAEQAGHSKLIYSPKPLYPTAARHSYLPIKGNGRYRVRFATNGAVKNVEVLESTRSDVLDNAATDALRKWKAAPGQEWSATVPITFAP